MTLYMLIALLITIGIVFSNPSLSVDSLKRYERRNFESLHDAELNNAYKRNQIYKRRFDSLLTVGRRGVVPTGTAIWRNGVFIYDISNINNKENREMILQAMKMITDDTAVTVGGKIIPCITFKERNSDDTTYITFNYTQSGCYTNGLGYRPGNRRTVNLDKSWCFTLGTIQHEIMHVLGFGHEHMRADRDKYISIALDKISPEWLDQYQKYAEGTTVDLLTPYDVNSIMHYPPQNMEPKKGVGEIKRLGKFSPIDIQEVRTLYQCKG